MSQKYPFYHKCGKEPVNYGYTMIAGMRSVDRDDCPFKNVIGGSLEEEHKISFSDGFRIASSIKELNSYKNDPFNYEIS